MCSFVERSGCGFAASLPPVRSRIRRLDRPSVIIFSRRTRETRARAGLTVTSSRCARATRGTHRVVKRKRIARKAIVAQSRSRAVEPPSETCFRVSKAYTASRPVSSACVVSTDTNHQQASMTPTHRGSRALVERVYRRPDANHRTWNSGSSATFSSSRTSSTSVERRRSCG